MLQLKNISFILKKTDFIGFIIELKQININLKKIKAIIKYFNFENLLTKTK